MTADDVREAAIEAGAKADFEADTGMPWEQASPTSRGFRRGRAAVLHDAMAPIILAGAAERPEASRGACPSTETTEGRKALSGRMGADSGAVVAESSDAGTGWVRVWVVLNTERARIHGVTCDLAEAQEWAKELVAKAGGDKFAATITVAVVTPPKADLAAEFAHHSAESLEIAERAFPAQAEAIRESSDAEDWARIGALWAELREWQRMHGDWTVQIEPWGVYGCVTVKADYRDKTYRDQGKSLEKRLTKLLAYLKEADRG